MPENLIPTLLATTPYIILPPASAAVMYLVARIMMIPREDMSYLELLAVTSAGSILGALLHSFHLAVMAGVFFMVIWAATRLQLNIRWRESLVLALCGLLVSYLLYFGITELNPFIKKDEARPVQAENTQEPEEVMHAVPEKEEAITIESEDLEVLQATEDDGTEKVERKRPKLPSLPTESTEKVSESTSD